MNDHDAIGQAVIHYEYILRWCVLPNPRLTAWALRRNRDQWFRNYLLWN